MFYNTIDFCVTAANNADSDQILQSEASDLICNFCQNPVCGTLGVIGLIMQVFFICFVFFLYKEVYCLSFKKPFFENKKQCMNKDKHN